MITGFNHNFKYRDRVYHIQTEDSGIKTPHVITHLFVGGNIIATKKTEYRHLLQEANAATGEGAVRALMEEQHKAMLRALIQGKFDGALNIENVHHLTGPTPLNVDADVLAATGGSGARTPASNLVPPALAASPPHGPLVGVVHPTPVALPAVDLTGKTAPAPVQIGLPPEVLAARTLPEKPVERPANETLFGEDFISEKRLDEVILGFLSQIKE
jgi:hypothetical protein